MFDASHPERTLTGPVADIAPSTPPSRSTRAADRFDLEQAGRRGVEIRPWPVPGLDLDGSVPPATHPVLYVVAADAPPPWCGELEDWLREPVDAGELGARVDRLVARARGLGATLVVVDDDDVLRVGDRLLILSPQEARLLRALVADLGQLVRRADLEAAIWPEGLPDDPRALDNRVKTLRERLAGLPLRLHTVRGRGLLLERLTEPE